MGKDVMQLRYNQLKDTLKFERPREKLLIKGPAALSGQELIAILLGSGVKGRNALEIGSTILGKLGDDMDQLTIPKLQAIEGVGSIKACRILAAFELARRYLFKEKKAIRCADDTLPFVQHIADKKQEYFVCMSLNGANEVIKSRVVTVGLLNSNQVHPREVFSDPIVDRAASVIVAHNHPSGNLEPSPEDVALTKRLVKAGEIIGITVLDHLIVTKRGYVSLKANGYL